MSNYKIITENGYPLKVGDKVKAKHAFGKNIYTIHRVTKTLALSKVTEAYTAKFPSIFGFGFSSLPRQPYNNTIYTVYSLID